MNPELRCNIDDRVQRMAAMISRNGCLGWRSIGTLFFCNLQLHASKREWKQQLSRDDLDLGNENVRRFDSI